MAAPLKAEKASDFVIAHVPKHGVCARGHGLRAGCCVFAGDEWAKFERAIADSKDHAYVENHTDGQHECLIHYDVAAILKKTVLIRQPTASQLEQARKQEDAHFKDILHGWSWEAAPTQRTADADLPAEGDPAE